MNPAMISRSALTVQLSSLCGQKGPAAGAGQAEDGGGVASLGVRRTAEVHFNEGATRIDATPRDVRERASRGFDNWWLLAKRVDSHSLIERRAGGRARDRFDGSEQTSTHGRPPNRDELAVVTLAGQRGMPGCSVSGGTRRLRARGQGVLFKLRNKTMGRFGEGSGLGGRRAE